MKICDRHGEIRECLPCGVAFDARFAAQTPEGFPCCPECGAVVGERVELPRFLPPIARLERRPARARRHESR